MAIERAYAPNEITALAVMSREGHDDRDHLYVRACGENLPEARIVGVYELLIRFGWRSDLSIEDAGRPGAQFIAGGPAASILGALLRQHPGEIRTNQPKRRRWVSWGG